MEIRALLVEDNPDDVELMRVLSTEMKSDSLNFSIAENLADSIAFASENVFDIVLLDLSLPDSAGIDTLKQFLSVAGTCPVIVMTGHNDEKLAVDAVHQGAQDYLIKGQVDANLLWRSIKYAIERKKMLTELEWMRQKERQDNELDALKQITRQSKTEVTARFFGLPPIRKYMPDIFRELSVQYDGLLNRAVEKRIYRVVDHYMDDLQDMADTLGHLKAGPRDLIDIHAGVLEKKSRGIPREKTQAYVDEGRIMLLELMGYLVMFYRNYYFEGKETVSVEKATSGLKDQR